MHKNNKNTPRQLKRGATSGAIELATFLGEDKMTPEQFKAAREGLGLNKTQLARLWGMGPNGRRTIGRWENATSPMSAIAAYCIGLMVERKSEADIRADERARVIEESIESINMLSSALFIDAEPVTDWLDTLHTPESRAIAEKEGE